MHLPLKLAISLPVSLAIFGGMIVGLSSVQGRRLHPVYGSPEGLFLGFFAGLAALFLVLPNAVGTMAANRFAADSTHLFIFLLASGVIATWFLQAYILNNHFRLTGPLIPPADWRILAVLSLDVLVLVGAAFWHGRSGS